MRSRHLLIFTITATAVLLSTQAFATIRPVDTPEPSVGSGVELKAGPIIPGPAAAPPLATKGPRPPLGAPPLSMPAVDGFDFDTNTGLNGSRFIPPDPHGAVGPDHAISIGNAIIEWRPKVGITSTPQFQSSLKGFFSALAGSPPGPAAGTTLSTNCFDPKVIYDQYAGRFVVVTLERWDVAIGNASNQSRILVAISKTSNPNDGFWFHAIDSKINIAGSDRWIDYPGVAVDDKALYITGNMFSFGAGAYAGVRLWIINKAPTYAGPNNNIALTVHDPYTAAGAAGLATTTQPAHMFGVLPTGFDARPLGTFLVSYSGLSDGINEYIDLVQVTDPLGVPAFQLQQLFAGDIDNTAVVTPDAPQLGSAFPIETNDRRALNAVWRGGNVYMCAELVPPAGADAAQTTAHWWRVSTASMVALALADQGNVGAEDLGAGTHTFYPSVMVDCQLNMAMGFSASNAAIFCGAYYTTRLVSDPAGTVSATGTLQAGLDDYKRFFSGPRNRWGDYSGIAICPRGEADFWVFNEYAGIGGTAGAGSQGAEDGRWVTKVGTFRVKAPTGVGDTPANVSRLRQNVPNPFNPSTTIRFELAASERVAVSVFDASGRLVRTLIDETRGAGPHEVRWDGRNARGVAQASGIYFYRLTAGSFTESRKMVLLK